MPNKKIYPLLLLSFTAQLIHSMAPNTITDIVPYLSNPFAIAMKPNNLEAYVLEQSSNDITIVDVTTNSISGTITGSPYTDNPVFVAISPNGLYAYVINNEVTIDHIVEINATSNTIIGTVNVGVFPPPLDAQALAFLPDSSRAYLVDAGTTFISAIDPVTNAITNQYNISTLSGQSIAISPDGSKAYIGVLSGQMRIFHFSDNSVTTLAVNNVDAIAFQPVAGGTKAYVARTGGVTVIDTTTDTVIDSVTGATESPSAIAFTSDGKTAYLVNQTASTVSIVDVDSNTVTGTVAISNLLGTLDAPTSLALTSTDSKGFITNSGGTTASVMTFVAHPILPPSSIAGCKIPLPHTLSNLITWTAPASGATPVEYDIYRDAGLTEFVASVSASDPLMYEDTNLDSNTIYTYYIVSVSSTDERSTAISVTVTSICSSVLLPPASISGCRTQNIFLTKTDFINNLTWTVPLGGLTPIEYKIYRDTALTQLVATIPASCPLQYLDHNRQPNIIYSYYIVSVDANGTVSEPNDVTVTQSC